MRNEILNALENASELERLYRTDPVVFAGAFNELMPEIKETAAARFWSARLEPVTEMRESVSEVKMDRFRLGLTSAACMLSGFLAKIPQLFSIPPEYYYIDNVPFIVLPLLAAYHLLKRKAPAKNLFLFLSAVLAGVIFMNVLPGGENSDTHILSLIHMTVLMWLVWGIVFVDGKLRSVDAKLHFVKHNGDLSILGAVILGGGVLLTGLTLGLFAMIKIDIHEFYLNYIAIIGGVSAPFVANYIIETNPKIVNKVAPLVAKIFTPLVLISITCFLAALAFFSNDPYSNREELIIFNMLLIAILAIVVFSFSGSEVVSKAYSKMLLLLTAEAIIVNCVAISAIVYRIAAFGITPNRAAVFGSNILMFINLIVITLRLWKFVRAGGDIEPLKKSMVVMFPYYLGWVIFVTFVFPLIFWFS